MITEFSTGMTETADYLAPGPDGNVWFTEYFHNRIGRITPAGVITEFLLPTGDDDRPYGIAPGPNGRLWFPEDVGNRIGRITTASVTPAALDVDARSVAGSSSNANGVLESGETVQVDPSWRNTLVTASRRRRDRLQSDRPSRADLHPRRHVRRLRHDPRRRRLRLRWRGRRLLSPDGRGRAPQAHWDATFTETLSAGVSRSWTVHVGESFPDVTTSNQFYASIENLFHEGITGGCVGGNYCPTPP